MAKVDYKSAGVNIDAGNEAVSRIKKAVEKTFSPQVLTGIGSFGSMYDLTPLMGRYQQPVLVQSIDGVGTKMIVARMMQCYDSIGRDLVAATANDIVVLGARPLTLLDYIAADRIDPLAIESIVSGMAQACLENEISLVGGETAEMPDTYLSGEHDLVGIVTGVVEKSKAITGAGIRPGDRILALPSSGLHTNGYSLARKLFFKLGGYTVDSYLDDLGETLGEALLKPHFIYSQAILSLLDQGVLIKGMAHITGGGLLENVPRVLPAGCQAEIRRQSWPMPALFSLMQDLGELEESEAYRTFNMGVGMVLIVAADQIEAVRQGLKAFPQFPVHEIGEIVSGEHGVRLVR